MKILVAEDECNIAMQYKLALEANGHEVRLTENGEDCLKAYRVALRHKKTRPHRKPEKSSGGENMPVAFDVVVLDYRMPKKDGMEVAKEILELCPDQRIIFASAYVLETLTESVKNLRQVVELLQKPFEIDTLVDAIEDRGVYEELGKLNVRIKELKNLDVTHAQLVDLLVGVKKLQTALLYGR
jgi:CheY-like chemotaxis protein